MEITAPLSCRGCLSQVVGDVFYSFVWKEIRDLFTECTSIEVCNIHPHSAVLVDISFSLPPTHQIVLDENGLFPQQLCSVCYNKCEGWRTFKTMCLAVDVRLQSQSVDHIHGQEPSAIRIKEEVMEEDDEIEIESFITGQVFKEEENDEEIEEEAPPEESIDKDDGDQCPVCDLVLSESLPLKKHLREHYSEEVKRRRKRALHHFN